jgi:phosphoglycolate phosphatase-like HAD superfamily hydrolase
MFNIELKKLLREKSVFVFDWDGTLLDSMGLKARNFGEAFCSIQPEILGHVSARDVSEHYLRLSGYPRKHIFFQIMAKLGGQTGQYSFREFNNVFEKLNRCSLIHARIFPDARALMDELIRRGNKIFISSSVPPQELLELVAATLPASVLAGIASILGSVDGHAKGKGHLRTIIQETGTKCNNLIVFGDDPADHELSTEAGVDCILVDRSGILNGRGIRLVESLIQIKNGLP